MSRPRKPEALKELNGTYKKNPQRRRDGFNLNTSPGDPPGYFDDKQIEAWNDLLASMPCEGVATHADRLTLEIMSGLLARQRYGEVTSSDTRLLFRMMSDFGMNPSDRQSLVPSQPDSDDGNEWSKLN